MDQSIIDYMQSQLDLKEVNIKNYSPLALAYIGDCVFELIVRTKIVSSGNKQVNKYHRESSSIVNAVSQSNMIKRMEPYLTEEEQRIYKRGRNAKPATKAKHATDKEYLMATGLEALIGYLYLTKQMERLIELMKIALEIGEEL